MNIFAVENDPVLAAQSLCDKHVISQTKESAQMLSTVHRLVSGTVAKVYDDAKQKLMKRWIIEENNDVLYQVAHPSHPCTLWTMKSTDNYEWHYLHFMALAEEFTYRYGKPHASFVKLADALMTVPTLPKIGLTPFALAMKSNPECMNEADPVTSYRKFYLTKRDRFSMDWTNRKIPAWFQ
jgi:hypothetical protein